MPATDAATVPRRMTFDRSGISGLGFLPDGASLIFASKRGGSSASNIWQIAVSGGEPIVIVTGGKNPINPAIAPDGKALVFVERQQDTNIWQLNSAPGIPPGGSSGFEKKLIASSRPDHSPQISPDGKKIVFVSDRAGISGLWISDLDGSNLLALGVEGGSPRFSPDSKFIAFGSLIDGKDTISIVSVDGGQPRRFVGDSADNMLPSWSADGHFIYFSSNRTGNLQLWKIGSDGGGDSVRLTTQGAFESFAAPDGESIFYTKDRGIGGMWRVSPTGADEGPIRELAEAGFWRYWTVTSNGLYYLAYSTNPPYHLKYYDFALRRTKEIAVTDRPPILTYSGLSVSPDGKTILYAQRDQNASNIILADLGK